MSSSIDKMGVELEARHQFLRVCLWSQVGQRRRSTESSRTSKLQTCAKESHSVTCVDPVEIRSKEKKIYIFQLVTLIDDVLWCLFYFIYTTFTIFH